MLQIDTEYGPAGAVLDVPEDPRALLVLGHGAGGGIDATDLRAVRTAAVEAGYAVARTLQPYRLAGRKAPAPAPQLDAAFRSIVTDLTGRVGDVPVVLGGRSSGARVACRTAADIGAVGVLALAFPLHPPARPDRSRAPELAAVRVPVLIVQGERDPFGAPAEFGRRRGVRLHAVPNANHSLAVPKSAPPVLPEITAAVISWLGRIVRTHQQEGA